MGSIAEVVAAEFDRTPVPRDVEEAMFGSSDPSVIQSLMDRFCEEQLGARSSACAFYASHQASVLGLELANGRHVCVKAFGASEPETFLGAMQQVQRHLVGKAFPCPRPIIGPRSFARGAAVVESLELDGRWADAHLPEIRAAMARSLAVLVSLTTELEHDVRGRIRSLDPPIDGSVWPQPHHAMFDFEGSARTAGWIDVIGRRARERFEAAVGDEVVAHADWSVKDMRFDGDRLVMIYDWQSLRRAPESVLVGFAAGTFTMQWHFEAPVSPELDEIEGFLDTYATARGDAFGVEEQTVARAAAAYALAYCARCEHSLDADATSFSPRSARDATRRLADVLLGP